MPISPVDSSIVVNNKVYYSYDFIKGLVDANTSITVQDDTMYIGRIIKKEYALLKCTFSIQKNLSKDGIGTLTIKADGKEINSFLLSKYDDILEIKDILINNCSMLTIEYATDDGIRGIVSDIEVYNF